MRIVDVEARDIYVLTEFSFTQLKNLDFLCNNMSINYDSTVDEEREAVVYLTEVFHPLIKGFIEETERKNAKTD